MANNSSLLAGNESVELSGARELCDLTQGFSFILQTVLGVLAFSTLLIKRYREPADCRRPFWIWGADTFKQALGMLEIHFLNLGLAAIVVEKECITYLVNFLLDSTIGLLLIFILLKLVALMVYCFKWTPLKSGEYGSPFKCRYWLAQCGVYLVVMLVEKLIVGPLIIFDFWNKIEVVLPANQQVRVVLVIFVVPFIVNVLMFWMVDSLLMRKQNKQSKSSPAKKHKGKYNKLKNAEESESESDEVLYTAMDQSSTISKQSSNSKSHRSINMNLLSKSDDR